MSRKPNSLLAMVPLSAAWLAAVMLVGACVSRPSPGQCPSVWNAPEFVAGCPAVAGITALAQFDDGTGPALYAGVSQSGSSIARWDGAKWTDVGGGTNGPVKALVVFDDGHGPALYVGGSFTMAGTTPTPSGIARWNGNAWSPLPAGAPSPTCLAVWDDGTGPAIYAAGAFTVATGAAGNCIAKFNGTSWSPLGSGLTGTTSIIASGAMCMMACNGSPGPGVYVGGYFTTAGATAVNGIARWNGTSWSALGSGVAGPSLTTVVQALALHDSGTGPALYAGGGFTSAGGVAANRIARWNGTSWSALGAGVNGKVTGLFSHDDGTGPQLWIGGGFTTAGATPAASIARWNGTAYSAVGAGFSLGFLETSVGPMTVFNPGSGPRLVVGGRFAQTGATTVNNVAQWMGGTWVPLSSSPSGVVRSAVVYDDGSGPALYVGGDFTFAGVVAASHVAKWNGSTWTALGAGVNGNVNAMAVFGGSLYVGGSFTAAGGLPANYVARWNGAAWSALGTGIAPVAGGTVNALIVFDPGTGPALHAGGVFANAGGNAVINVARWSGTAWSAAGDGLNGPVDAFAAFDDGAGVKLHAGGLFATTGGGATVNNVAKLSGTTWAALGAGTAGEVYALGVYGAGNGLLYAGGAFTSAGGNGALAQLARWNGSAWSSAGASPGAAVRALASVTDLAGTFLYAGGDFTAIGGIAASHVARYDGTTWAAMNQGTASAPAGPGAAPLAFAPFTVGGSTLVHAVGQFGKADGAYSFYVGRFGPYPPSIGHGPAPVTTCAGTAATLSVTASGATPFTYQWRRNAVVIPGATSSSYSIASTSAEHAGAYSVEVTNGCGSVTSASAVLTVNAPSITTQPAGAAVCEGAAASFSVVASGVAPLAYQWRKNAVNIAGATSSSYSIASTMAGDAAAYSVVVTDGCGSVTSADALLTVNMAPSITTQPAGATVCEGAAASFSVAAAGGGSFTYQWRKNAVDIPGATSSSYSIASTVAGDAATYSVEATNGCGSVTSANAVLTVNTLSIMSQPGGATVCEGAAASFSVAAAGTRPLTYQWRKNAVNILGATASSYSIAFDGRRGLRGLRRRRDQWLRERDQHGSRSDGERVGLIHGATSEPGGVPGIGRDLRGGRVRHRSVLLSVAEGWNVHCRRGVVVLRRRVGVGGRCRRVFRVRLECLRFDDERRRGADSRRSGLDHDHGAAPRCNGVRGLRYGLLRHRDRNATADKNYRRIRKVSNPSEFHPA